MKKLFRNRKKDHYPYLFDNDINRKRPPKIQNETALYELGKKWNVLKYREINMTGYI